jgi:acetylornithine deacetylase/succinyl-diaminopimelate desuccinylase-like protein
MAFEKKQLAAFAKANREAFESLLGKFVEIPTVSAQPEHLADIARGVELATATISDFGGRAEVIETAGNPIVHGVFDAGPGLPSVTVYNHLDVQPASKETEPWDSEPFVFTSAGGTYRGRGTTDDKGPALAALFGIKAARDAGVPVNLRVLWEFEEEIGSPNFEKGIASAKERLATDSILVSDTIWVSRQRPACPAGLRGMAGFVLTLETATTDVHSGVTGGVARNPLGELMQLASKMYDATTGKVKIPGFYDDVAKLSKAEKENFLGSGFTAKHFKKATGLKKMRTEDPLEMMTRLWAMPTMEIHGLVGGYTGAGVKTIIPPRAELKISFRLVSDQKPAKIAKLVRDFVCEHAPDVRLSGANTMQPYKAPIDGPLAENVKAAMKFAFGREPVFVREGGSIGAVPSMEKVLRCPVMFLGLSLPEHGYHAPNENFDWGQASGGMAAFAKYFELVAKG